jgi:hypothetical protein
MSTSKIYFNTRKLHLEFFQSFTRQSKFTYGLVLEEIKTRDEDNNICTHGSRVLPSGALNMDGPPTTFSGTGVDRMAFLQANITRDNTEFVNGATIGDRCIFQVGGFVLSELSIVAGCLKTKYTALCQKGKARFLTLHN